MAIGSMGTPKGKLTTGRILQGIETGLAGSGIELELVLGEAVAEEGAGETGKVVKRTGKGVGGTGGLTVRAFRNKALVSKLIFINIVRAGFVGKKGGKREKAEGGDVAQIVAGALIGFVLGITFLDLVVPEGEEGTERRSEGGNLIIPGGLEGFATEQSLASVLGEAFRILVPLQTIPDSVTGPVGGGGGGGF